MESSQHKKCIYRDKLGKLTNYKTLPVNPNNTIQSNLEGSKPLITILSSQIKPNTHKLNGIFLIRRCTKEVPSPYHWITCLFTFLNCKHRQKHITVMAQSSTKPPNKQGYAVIWALLSTHTMIVQMDGNQTEYSQHRLSLYQQPFNSSSTVLLRLFWTMRAHFHPAQGVVFSPLTLLALGLPEPTGWKRQKTTHFPLLLLPPVAVAPSWDPHGASLMQVCTGGCLTAAVLGKSSCRDGASFHCKSSSLLTSIKETEPGVGDTHTSKI